MEIKNQKLTLDEFYKERAEVLAQWHTGKEVNLTEAIDYQRSLPPHKNYARKLAWAKETGAILIRTDSGVPSLEEHIEYLKYLQDTGGSDLLGTMVDSFTRTHRFKESEQKLKESVATGKWLLNGLPIVAYGVANSRRIIDAVDLPVAIRGNALDFRLVAEIALAGGHSDLSSTAFMSFWHYSSNAPFEVSVRNHQYNYRLIGCYEEAGAPISAIMSGGFTILCPYSVIQAAIILDALIAAEQGTRNIHLSVQYQGNLAQDIAAAFTLRKLTQRYLDRFGYKNMIVTLDSNAWSGQFPVDAAEAFAILSLSVTTSVLSGAEIAHVKTIEEAISIPTKEGNAASLRAGKKIINMLKDQKIPLDNKAIAIEAEILELEVTAIVDKVVELGNGDIVVGSIRAIKSGVIDNPFATNINVAGKILGVRDNEGAVRYLDHGNLPFTKEIVEFNKKKIAEREKAMGKKVDYETVVNDLYSIARGPLVSK